MHFDAAVGEAAHSLPNIQRITLEPVKLDTTKISPSRVLFISNANCGRCMAGTLPATP